MLRKPEHGLVLIIFETVQFIFQRLIFFLSVDKYDHCMPETVSLQEDLFLHLNSLESNNGLVFSPTTD